MTDTIHLIKPFTWSSDPHSERFNIEQEENSRDIMEHFITGQHVSLESLIEQKEQLSESMQKYLTKEIPPYPTPVEFLVSEVAHVTEETGFNGILESGQFSPGEDEFSWWELKVNKDEIRAAEDHYRETNPLIQAQVLEKFTTSPPFQPEVSRYGNYRFTFPLTDLMQWYKEQNCGEKDPVLRVHKTVTYKQEIMYTVLIHSPEDNQRFGKKYPLLKESKWVQYQDGKIIWKAQAICETHRYELLPSGEVQELKSLEYYVWDHVSLVFHLPNSKTLKIPNKQLKKAVDACKLDTICLMKTKEKIEEEQKRKYNMKAFEKVRKLKQKLEEEENE